MYLINKRGEKGIMKLSTILKSLDKELKFEARNEIDFGHMGLASMLYEGTLCTFIDDPKYINEIINKNVIIITTREIAKNIQFPVIIVENPRICFFRLHNYLVKYKHPEYIRGEFNTQIGKDSTISKLACVENKNVIIGNNVLIEEFVSIKANTVIGDNTIIRAGTVIGGEGFEAKRMNEGILPVTHAGGVIIENDVEIKYNTCIDKALYPWDNTVISEGCKIDNLIHIAHAVKISKETLIAASALIGGRSIIGKQVWIGAGATISNNISVGDGAKISIGSVVTKNVNSGQRVSGNFAIDHSKFLNHMKIIR